MKLTRKRVTATPYRMDRQNVFEHWDYNVVYEADQFTAINRDWLTPFYYYGIYDATVNYDNVTYLNGKYLESELEAELNKKSRRVERPKAIYQLKCPNVCDRITLNYPL